MSRFTLTLGKTIDDEMIALIKKDIPDMRIMKYLYGRNPATGEEIKIRGPYLAIIVKIGWFKKQNKFKMRYEGNQFIIDELYTEADDYEYYVNVMRQIESVFENKFKWVNEVGELL